MQLDKGCFVSRNEHFSTIIHESLVSSTSEVGGAQSVSFAVTATVFVLPVLALMF